MKKICYFINSDWYFDLHWIERACAAQNKGYQIHIMTRFKGEELYNKFTLLGFICHNIHIKDHSLNPLSFFFTMMQVWFKLLIINPSIIHSITIKPVILGGVYSRIFRKPFIANIVGLGRIFDCDSSIYIKVKKIVIFIYKQIFKNEKIKIIFEHNKDRDFLEKNIKFKFGQTIIIDGAGVDTTIFSYREEKENIKPIVFFAGRMLKNKGLDTLVDIKRELNDLNIHFDLVVAGIEVFDDPYAIPTSILKSWHEQGDIVWLGERRDIAQLISNSNIIALPTLYPEGVPRILIEACAIGRSCIAYNSGGCSSIIENGITGYLIEKNNKKEFRDKLIILIKNPELRKEMGINGHNLVKEKFSSAKVINLTLCIYSVFIDECYN
uniref:glycosyltransferase family 4 protein n=1 Tax=Rosenbergiella australiborealis TaxID=1544696 RepID=UPI001F4D8D4F